MRKYLIIALCLLISGCAFAITDKQKSDIKANRQIYHTKRKMLSKQLDNARAEYMTVTADETVSPEDKQQRINELEAQIYKINEEKIKLKRLYERDKKAIKGVE